MEQAYNELYSEFVRLRSICIRQAAMLQKLSRELHKPHASDESFSGVASMPVQCSQEHTHQDRIPPLIATNKDASPNSGVVPHHRPVVEILSLNVPRRRETNKEEEEEESPQPPASPALRSPADSGAGSYEAAPRKERRKPRGPPTAWGYSPLTDGEGLHPSGGAFMSEMELQSQMCEFCHAIFPGQTATRGEFLRHLHTHIT